MKNEQFIYPALLQRRVGDLKEQRVRCLTCERRCTIAPGETGWCRTRQNRDGTLVTLTYGLVSSLAVNPIEKKPLYHFYPGSTALTVGAWSCNFDCPWCQNWDISKQPPASCDCYSPARFVAEAINRDCQGISISFNEPTLSLEWALESFRLARQAGLYSTFITNGYMTTEALARLARSGLDAMNVDVKGDAPTVRSHCGADSEIVWRNLALAQELGVWTEVTTLIIPGVTDDPEMMLGIAARILRTLGPHTPWHVTRYHPAHRFTAPPTALRSLETARSLGQQVGLRYIYLGNTPGHFAENTYCPVCGRMLVRRWERTSTVSYVRDGRCPDCAEEISGMGWEWQRRANRR